MKAKVYVPIAAFVVAVGAAASYASPYWTMHEMKTALSERDADAFSSYVDFPAVRDNVRGQLMVQMKEKMSEDGGAGGQGGFAALGMMLGMGILNQAIDVMVSPAGVMAMMSSASPKAALPDTSASESPQQETPLAVDPSKNTAADPATPHVSYTVGYKNWSTVLATVTNDEAQSIRFVFKRNGLWSWKMSAIDLPMDSSSADAQ